MLSTKWIENMPLWIHFNSITLLISIDLMFVAVFFLFSFHFWLVRLLLCRIFVAGYYFMSYYFILFDYLRLIFAHCISGIENLIFICFLSSTIYPVITKKKYEDMRYTSRRTKKWLVPNNFCAQSNGLRATFCGLCANKSVVIILMAKQTWVENLPRKKWMTNGYVPLNGERSNCQYSSICWCLWEQSLQYANGLRESIIMRKPYIIGVLRHSCIIKL